MINVVRKYFVSHISWTLSVAFLCAMGSVPVIVAYRSHRRGAAATGSTSVDEQYTEVPLASVTGERSCVQDLTR